MPIIKFDVDPLPDQGDSRTQIALNYIIFGHNLLILNQNYLVFQCNSSLNMERNANIGRFYK